MKKASKAQGMINMHKFVVDQLQLRRGEWMQISTASDVPYFTLAKIASGVTEDPRISSCQKLADYFAANPKGQVA